MIRFHVVSVTRKASGDVRTGRITYENDVKKVTWTDGAEWEEIEFREEFFEQPTIQIANVAGDYTLIGQPKIIINNPALFGTYKVGDIIEFMPKPAEIKAGEYPTPLSN